MGPQSFWDRVDPTGKIQFRYMRGLYRTFVLSRMLGKLSFDGDIASWSEKLTGRMARWVEQFKAVRHLYVQDFYQLLPMPTTLDDWDAVEFVSYSGDDAVVLIFAGISGGQRTIRMYGLMPNQDYTVHQPPDGPAHVVRGLQLLEQGLSAKLDPCHAGLWRVIPAN